MKKIHPAILAIVSGLLLFASWPVSPFSFLIFVAFLPLFWLEQQQVKRRTFFIWIYVAMLIWNVSTTWWIMNSTVPGGIAAMLANSLIMCVPWIGFYNIKRRMGATVGYVSFIATWLTFEYVHLNWELSWPWLTLGNVFAVYPNWVQWYEYTGVSGGSLWVLLVNVTLFLLLKHSIAQRGFHVRRGTLVIGLLLLPFLMSYYVEGQRSILKERTPNNIVVVQPNVDPYEKFEAGTAAAQLNNLLRLTESAVDTHTRLVVWPETAIPVAIDEAQVMQHPFLQPVFEMLKRHPHIRLLTGIEGYRFFDEQGKTKYSRRYPDTELYFDAYNSAALMDSSQVQLYHKSKLVPGVETLPSFLGFLDKWFEQFGGTTGGYARQDERTILHAGNTNYKIAPSICYESIYGEFMSKYIRNGANLIVIITNDGWWAETAGFRQHMNYARLRAIETRRWVARSANTGISCFIDPKGNVLKPQPWNTVATIKHTIPDTYTNKTFYALNGDYIYRIALGFTIILVIWNIFLIIKRIIRGKKAAVSR
ncbi:MAG TPA: apolipoprotein N-acyltransferase [Chitinophagaceae bacterium]|nr:apolipoprotein N-acyltransferase [Chitinophagaceae bacterium]